VIGQICLNPTPVTPALGAAGRDLDLSPFTRKKRQASDTSSSGVNFQQAKEACEQDLGGELFSLGELFPTEDCEGKFLNFVPAFEPDTLVTNNYGTVQNAMGQLLEGSSEKFWVNSQRESGDSQSLYKYDGESPFTYHVTSDNSQGSCLTYSSDLGNLYTSGANCADFKRPLCYRSVSSTVGMVESLCNCATGCNRWVNLINPTAPTSPDGGDEPTCAMPGCGRKGRGGVHG